MIQLFKLGKVGGDPASDADFEALARLLQQEDLTVEFIDMKHPPRRGTNWDALLEKEERGRIKGKDVVYLRGLRRLAEKAGILSSTCVIMTPDPKLVQAVYHATFDDGTTWVGTGDCSPKNSEEPYVNFPTSIAESRAEARCLKKALGISTLAAEEIGFESLEASPSKSVDQSIIKAIESLCASKSIDAIEAIEAVVTDKDRAIKISELNQLTAAEGQAAMAWLNEQSARKPKPTAASTRADRKKELEGKLGN
jgi:hypothetical protein